MLWAWTFIRAQLHHTQGSDVFGVYVHPGLPKGPKVAPFRGSYLEFYKVIPKRNYFGAYGKTTVWYLIVVQAAGLAWGQWSSRKEAS